MALFRAAVITVSDSSFLGKRADASGPSIVGILDRNGFSVIRTALVPDEKQLIIDALLAAAASKAELIITTGGTGFSPQDITPEATLEVIERQAPGIAEAIRRNGAEYTPRAFLSRGIAGIRGSSLIINLPGSPKAVEEALSFILPILGHGLEILSGGAGNCAR